MLSGLLVGAYAPAALWAAGFAAPPRIPLVGDVNADGYADLICVYPPGGAIIDVSLNQGGQKAGVPFQALNPWGTNCQAAAAGELDDNPGADVAGVFDGDTIRLAFGFANGKFKDNPAWAKLPRKLKKPSILFTNGRLIVWSAPEKLAFEISRDGRVSPSSMKAFADAGRPSDTYKTPAHVRFNADMDSDGDLDVVDFCYTEERHKAYDVSIERLVSPGERDSDADGLTNEEEAALKTDPYNPDSDGDGLLDGWETSSYRGLDLKALGCSPLRTDVIALISRFAGVDEPLVKKELERVKQTYAGLDSPNPDGSKGFSFHPVYLEPVPEADQKNPWWVNRDKFRPAKWKGLVHWMQIGPGGGGQADQMGDGGGCGVNALWAVFLHEFGHQMGMDHNGFWEPGLSPIYTSLMNYAYSYSLEDDGSKIGYSTGKFLGFTLDERRLDENLPYPYDAVKFLEKGPYRFRLKPSGQTTLVDWNWNGVFGERGIRADINYSYSTNAGRRDEIGKIMTSPWLFTQGGRAWAVYGTHNAPADPKKDPSIGADLLGDLLLRELVQPFRWKEPVKLASGLAGDPVAIGKGDTIYVVFARRGKDATEDGVFLQTLKRPFRAGPLKRLSADPSLVPTVGRSAEAMYVFLWNPATGEVSYRTLDRAGALSAERRLLRRSTIPVGMALDTIKKQVVLGAAEDQDRNRPSRWQIRRYHEIQGRLYERAVEWIEGEAGQARGYGRATLLFDGSKEAGKEGRLYFFGRGLNSKETPWACTYVAMQIADKTVRGGWLVKRFYDEWTQTRSAPAAAWFGGDVIWAYRWVDGSQGERDNLFHVGYRALGIDEQPMGDHDDVSFFREIGIRRSILYLGPE